MKLVRRFESPYGALTLETAGNAVTGVRFGASPSLNEVAPEDELPMRRLAMELTEYFSGVRTAFDLPVAAVGTPFQQAVWKALQEIPFHEVRTYREVAEIICHPKAYRAVGMACHVNPVAILIPCHRVVAAGHKPGGFGGGAAWKQALLALEKITL